MRFIQNIKFGEIFVELAPTSETQQESLKLRGQRQPIRLVEFPPGQNKEFKYRIVDGRRRLVDMIKTGVMDGVSALVYTHDEVDNESFHLDALTLNSGKPNFMDEADHIKYLLDECGYTTEDISVAVNLSISTIQNRLDIKNKLIEPYQDMLRCGTVRVSAVYELVKIPKTEQQKIYDAELFSVKKIARAVRQVRNKLNTIPVKVSDQPPMDIPHSSDEKPVDIPSVGPGLFLTFAEVTTIINDGTGLIVYDGSPYIITLTVGQSE